MPTKVGKHLLDGRPVHDAVAPLVLHINNNDVTKADRKEPLDCVVARCARREHHVEEVKVHIGRVYVRRRNQEHWTKYETPKPLAREIIAFDRGGKFEVGEYQLHPIRKCHTVDARKSARKRSGNKKNPKFKRRKPHVVHNIRSSAVQG